MLFLPLSNLAACFGVTFRLMCLEMGRRKAFLWEEKTARSWTMRSQRRERASSSFFAALVKQVVKVSEKERVAREKSLSLSSLVARLLFAFCFAFVSSLAE